MLSLQLISYNESFSQTSLESDVEARDDIGTTPLMYASMYGNTELAGLLIEYGADIEAKEDYGNTSLIIACVNKEVELAKLLLEEGADPNASSYLGITALSIVSSGEDDLVSLLRSFGGH